MRSVAEDLTNVSLSVKDDLNRTHIICRERKTGKKKRFPINTELREIITKYTKDKDDDEPLFRSRKTGRHVDRVQAYRILNTAAAEVRLCEIGTHTLRKTFGYHLYQRTKDVALLQEIFNHSAPSITMNIHRHQSRHYRSSNKQLSFINHLKWV